MSPPPDQEQPGPEIPARNFGPLGRPAGADTIELGRDHAPRRAAGSHRILLTASVAALAAGVVLGYLAGYHQARAKAGPRLSGGATATAAPAAGDTVLTDTGNRCAVQLGHELQLGIQISNSSSGAVVLREVRPILPLGGLRATASSWGTCGELPVGAGAAPSLAAGSTGWLTMTFDVLTRCPRPLPVQFNLSYTQAGKAQTVRLDAFPDLGNVRYTGCPGP